MRELLVTELVKEVLGPRRGIKEVLDEDENPLTEYITGVLAPVTSKKIREIEDESEIPSEDSQTYEEETIDADVNAPILFYPALDPKSRPSTMGLSFLLEAPEGTKIKACLTWARYFLTQPEKEGLKSYWQREPRFAVFEMNPRSSEPISFDGKGKRISNASEAEISFHCIARPSGVARYMVDVYIINQLKPIADKHAPSSYIFQPQIRVTCLAGTKLLAGIRKTPEREEERKLEFLYRERPVFARGHLCSAMWRDIDPENHEKLTPALLSLISENAPPFSWVDGEQILEGERKQFSPPDVRTEFVPMYSIPFPELGLKAGRGRQPVLDAANLAQMWDTKVLSEALSPLIVNYEEWINGLRNKIDTFSEPEKRIAVDIIQNCQTVLMRMKDGEDLLLKDDDARLAFCFANQAINLQYRWSHGKDFVWYPFQLAFILVVVESLLNLKSVHRSICDTLWVPTGAGKTEAYLALVAMVSAYRRRRALKGLNAELTGAGISAITRYTLRLLTIQQFRRALSIMAACEYLRIQDLTQKKPVGWRPEKFPNKASFIWGSTPFSIGLWVGSGVSPNRLQDLWGQDHIIAGALSILKGLSGEGEPAQVLNCPACKSLLAVPEMGLQPGKHTIHLVVKAQKGTNISLAHKVDGKTFQEVTVLKTDISTHVSEGFYTLTIDVETPSILKSRDVDGLWHSISDFLRANGCSVEHVPVRASRPGYFIRHYAGRGNKEYDFEIFCPKPSCPLHQPWCGGAPFGWIHGKDPSNHAPSPDGNIIPVFPDGNRLTDIQEPFHAGKNQYLSDRIPIPAMTVEEQVFARLPTVLVATVDKFARPPFEPKAASLFGNVEFHHCVYGYYRRYQHPAADLDGHPSPAGTSKRRNFQRLPHPLEHPDLIIQDELHLIEGPLGSLVGFYETAIDFLCSEGREQHVKYIASTATVRRAEEQIKAVFLRELQLFPPHGLTADDRFFVTDRETHALDSTSPGRLYVGICAPGRGPLTPIRNIYARLLQTVWWLRNQPDSDNFWTLTGYFNAVRELAGARALYRQDIPQRVDRISRQQGDTRQLSDEKGLELSSRTPSTDLPAILDILGRTRTNAPDCLFSTSMFGTGVDIQRIGLMVVNGQPKTTAAYIQSTGRVGRSKGALIVTFLRASRPRDLSHYEFFMGYHRHLHRFVEPITTYPFSLGVLDRAAGPLSVFILRNMRNTTVEWHRNETAALMSHHRTTAPEVQGIPAIMISRESGQPKFRKPLHGKVKDAIDRKLDTWQSIAANNPNLRYVEYAIGTPPQFPVVLGDYQHHYAHLGIVYDNAPRSLRDVEETTGFQT
jgi:hypothetical protein